MRLARDDGREYRKQRHAEADGHIQYIRLPADGKAALGHEGAYRQNERKVDDVCTDDIADGHRGFLLADGSQGRYKLRQRGADGDHGNADYRSGNAEQRRKLAAVGYEKLRAADDRRNADNEQDYHLRCVLFVGGVHRLGADVLLCVTDIVVNVHGKDHKQDDARQKFKSAAPAKQPQKRCRKGHERCLEPEAATLHGRGYAHERNAHDKTDVRRNGADGVADRHVVLTVNDAQKRHGKLRQSGTQTDYRRTDDELGYSRYISDPHGGIHEPVSALDDKNQSRNKQ